MDVPELRVIGVGGLPEVSRGADLAALIADAAARQSTPLEAGDVVVVTQKIVSKAEGRIVALADVEPGPDAVRLGAETEKDPRLVELNEYVRALDAGGLSNSRYLEEFTVLLLHINRTYKARSGVRITGV